MPSLTKVQSGFMEAQGALPLSSGTAAAPGLKFSDHAGTGMFSPSTGAIGFSTSSKQNALTMHTDGSVVINGTTSNVVGRLTVAGDGKDIVFGRTESTGTGGTGRLVATGNIVYLQAGANASSGSAADLVFGAYGGVGERLRITSGGRLGLGEISPDFKFHGKETGGSTIVGLFETNQTDAFISFKANGTTAGSTVRIGALGDDFVAYINGDYRFRIHSDGDIEYKYNDADTSAEVGATQIPHGLRIYNTNNTLGRLAGIHFSHGLGGTANAGIFHETTNTASGSTTCLGDLVFYTKNSGVSYMTEKVRLTSAGDLLVNHDSSAGSGKLQVFTNNQDGIDIFAFSSTAANGGRLTFYRSKNGGVGNFSEVANGDSLGRIDWRGYNDDGTANNLGATIEALVSGSVNSTTDMPSDLVFKTSPDSSSSPTERFRIRSTGIPQFTTTGTQYASASVPAFVVNSNGDHALVLNNQNTTDPRGLFIFQDQDVNNTTSYFLRARAGGSDKAHLYSNGNLVLAGGMQAASVNLQSSSTSSWFQTGTSLYSTNYVWAAKNSSSNTWHSGLQTDGDLLLGNVLNDARIGIYGSSGSMALKNATTSAKLNIQTDVSGNYTGWKERNVASGSMSQASIDSKTPTINDFTYPNSSNGMLIWSTSKIGFAAGGESPQYGTGVQMVFDSGALMLGGLRAFDRTASSSTTTNWTTKLNTNGSASFKGTVYTNPLQLTSSDSWIKSGYGAITNSTVSSLNNLMIAQNIRGYIQSLDGGSTNNNFYHIVTHGGMGYCGTEYCYDGITKFYNSSGGTTANATFTPVESVRIERSGVTSGAGFKFSNTGSSGTTLPNPFHIGNLSSNSIAYPHIPGIYYVRADSPCDNTFRTILSSINDSTFVIEGISGDASSKRSYKLIGAPTSPGYGVNRLSEDYNTGAWNTGDIEFRLDGTHPNWNLQVKTTSYYSSSSNATIRFHLFVYY